MRHFRWLRYTNKIYTFVNWNHTPPFCIEFFKIFLINNHKLCKCMPFDLLSIYRFFIIHLKISFSQVSISLVSPLLTTIIFYIFILFHVETRIENWWKKNRSWNHKRLMFAEHSWVFLMRSNVYSVLREYRVHWAHFMCLSNRRRKLHII